MSEENPTIEVPAIEVVCERIERLTLYRAAFASQTKRGDLMMMYLGDEKSGFTDATIARHIARIVHCEDLLDAAREGK